jgi:hypothetical protein
MRAMQWALGLGAALTMGGAVATGCGSSDNSNPPADSGPDVVADHSTQDVGAMDTGSSDAAMDMGMMACMSDADLTMIMVPDAALPDAGGISLAACVNCLEGMCHSQLESCNMDCTCHDAIAGALPCIQMMGLSLTCLGTMILTDPAGMALGACALSNCGAGICTPGGGGDGGGGDSSTDSAVDAPVDAPGG